MSGIDKYVRLARASRNAGFTLPVIESADEALAVVRELAGSLARLPEGDRLALLGDLKELSLALEARTARLRQEMEDNRRALSAARTSRRACAAYARYGGGAPLRRRR